MTDQELTQFVVDHPERPLGDLLRHITRMMMSVTGSGNRRQRAGGILSEAADRMLLQQAATDPLSRGDEFDEQVARRHHQVADITRRHLEALHKEILQADPLTLNIDGAGDQAEVAHQVIVALVNQLRCFGVGARTDLAEKREERRQWGFEEEDDPDPRRGE